MESLFKEAVAKIEKITDIEELREINRITSVQFKLIRDKEINLITWLVGKAVKMKPKHQNTKPWDTKGIITKVNSKTLGIDFGMNGQYRVHKAMLELVD